MTTATNPMDMLKQRVDEAEQMARQIWLAGLGAYGKGFEELTSRCDKLEAESKEVFQDLVKRGSEIEKQNDQRVKSLFAMDSKADETADKANTDKLQQQIAELNSRLDSLVQAVDKLSKPTK